MENIYALYYEWEDERRYFYVGRTGRDPKIRHNEHRQKSRTGSEDVYKYIREKLQPSGIDVWDMEVLYSEPNGRPEDTEDFWVVLMIRAGHDLKNMKHGDLHRVALELLARKSGEFSTVDEFVEFRTRVEREDYKRSLRLQREIRGETENPHIDIQNLVNVATERFQFQHGRRMAANQKKEQRAIERAREKEAWLRNQRGLFK
jgi:hypothetical protein